MSSSTTPQPQSPNAGGSANVVPVDAAAPSLTWEEQIQLAWAKHRGRILLACAIVLVAIVGVGLAKQYAAARERSIGEAFGAADTPEKLRTFAGENAAHPLAGAAWLKLGDQAYEAGRFSEAAGHYEKAVPLVSSLPFGGRAVLAQAMSQLAAGEKSKGEQSLRAIVADAKQDKAIRAEAGFNLAILAKEAGRIDEARKLLGEIEAGGAGGFWAQQALIMKLNLPAEIAPAAPAAAPVSLTLPGKP